LDEEYFSYVAYPDTSGVLERPSADFIRRVLEPRKEELLQEIKEKEEIESQGTGAPWVPGEIKEAKYWLSQITKTLSNLAST
jgi:hypothetical protein